MFVTKKSMLMQAKQKKKKAQKIKKKMEPEGEWQIEFT